MDVFFRHYKNRYYQLIGEALDTSNDSMVVVYRTLYLSDFSLFTRPKDEFFGFVLLNDGSRCLRFTPVPRSALPEDALSLVIDSLPVPCV